MAASDLRLTYLSGAAFPSRSSNAIQTLRMCAAFASAGVEVDLVYVARRRPAPEGFSGDLHAFYGVPDSFNLRELGGVPGRVMDRQGSDHFRPHCARHDSGYISRA